MVDCHIHMVLDGVNWKDAIARHKAAPQEALIRQTLGHYQALGFSYLRDGGDRWGVGAKARSLAGEYGVRPFLHLSTLTAAGTFSAAQAAVVLRSEALQQTLAEAVLQKMQEKGYMGLDVDFEYLGRELAEAYAQFLSRLHGLLAPYGLPLIAALAPKTSADQPGTLYEGYDYAAVASACDAVLLMT
jgi:spore germination protein YaaH